MNQRGITQLLVLGLILALIVVVFSAGSVYIRSKENGNTNKVVVNKNTSQDQNANIDFDTNTNVSINTASSGETTFKNNESGYQLSYPKEWFHVSSSKLPLCLFENTNNCQQDCFSSVDPQKVEGAYSGGFDFCVLSYQLEQNGDYLTYLFQKDEDISADFYEYPENNVTRPQLITVDGQLALRYAIDAPKSTEPCYIEEVLIQKDRKIFDLEAIVQDKSAFENYRTEFENIVESIKFF